MKRPELDAFCCAHQLPSGAIATALALTGERPDAPAWRAFAATVLRAAGLGALGAGILFFVAANWQDYGVLGRFALLQVALLACIAAALRRPPPTRIGASALILSTLLTGGLLALFGQTYQTGADLHELFFTWSLLALPFALAAMSGALWALWWCVLNVGMALLCGWLGTEHVFWSFIDSWGLDRSALMMLPCVVNLLAAAACVALRGTRLAAAAPAWLARLLATFGMLAGTAAALGVAASGLRYRGGDEPLHIQGTVVMLAFTAICTVIGVATWQRKQDVFPMALLAASWIAISTTWLARVMRFNNIGTFFVLALWLIAASTAAGMLLMHWLRQWRADVPASNLEGAAA